MQSVNSFNLPFSIGEFSVENTMELKFIHLILPQQATVLFWTWFFGCETIINIT